MEKKSSNSDSHSFYITTPIFYPNARLHLGHAYTTTVCDILARYHRLKGDKTYFLTGSDENTEKVVRAATVAGKSTKDYLDEIVGNFKDLFSKLGISYDQFIRTTDEIIITLERSNFGTESTNQEIWRNVHTRVSIVWDMSHSLPKKI